MNQNHLLLLFLCTVLSISAQKQNRLLPDSITTKSYDYLNEKIDQYKKDSLKASIYMYAYLNKAKKEQNWKEIVNSYQNLLHQSPDNLRLVYADSMIHYAKKSNNEALIGSAYLSKGIVYYGQKKHNLALDNYLISNSYISKTNDDYLIHKVKYHIALIKYYIGFYDEAISLLKECITYFKDDNPRAYLNSIHSLGLCYNKIGNYNLCSETNSLGLLESKRLKIKEMEPYFIHSQGINEFFKLNYGLAIKDIKSSLGAIIENKDFANESIGNFYIGKSYWNLQRRDNAVPFFKKVDLNFNTKAYIRPDLRETYELLIDYYKNKNNLENQLYYIDQLLRADSLLVETNKYLIGKVHKEYDTKELLHEKNRIKAQLILEKYYDYIFIGIILLLFLVILYGTYRHYKNQKLYKQRFDELMLKVNDKNWVTSKINTIKPKILKIKPQAIANILKQLQKFEDDKRFLEKDWNLIKLSAAFNSNTKYLSKIIFHYRDKRFVEYVNDLKIDYIINLLKEDRIIRNYTNKALAEEAGFSSTQRFVNAFKSKTKMPTAFFIEEIKKEKI